MKQIKYLFVFSLTPLFFGCERNPICPDESEYHFFTSDELNFLWEDIDSALIFQSELNTADIGQYDINRFYNKIDGVQFVNQNYDTSDFTMNYLLQPGLNQWCPKKMPMIAQSVLYANEESFISRIEIELEKNINDKLIYKIEFEFSDGMDLSTIFSLADSIKIDFSIFNGSVDKSKIIYLTTYIDAYQFNNEQLDNCLWFQFRDQNYIENFKAIYSNKYGFLKIIKNSTYEIQRCL